LATTIFRIIPVMT